MEKKTKKDVRSVRSFREKSEMKKHCYFELLITRNVLVVRGVIDFHI